MAKRTGVTIPDKVWTDYVTALRMVSEKAASEMSAYLATHEWWKNATEKNAAIDFAFALSTKYGEAAAELACEMYQAIAEASIKSDMIDPPEPAPTARRWRRLSPAR